MLQDIFVIGSTGRVGRELVFQIFQMRDDDSLIHANPTRIVGVCSSKSFLYSKNGLSREDVINFSEKKLQGFSFKSVFDLLKIVDIGSNIIFVDVSAGGRELLDFQLRVLRETNMRVVGANKNPLVISSYDEFRELVSVPSRYGFRCSVMAGAEAVTKMLDLLDLNDKPKLIEGCFSGTLGLLASEMEKGKKLSFALSEAIRDGYTEPDPVLDLVGDDVAKKMLILARSAGFRCDFSDVHVSPFVPRKAIVSSNKENLLIKIKKLDPVFSKMFSTAVKEGFTYRYVGSFDSEKKEIRVRLKKVLLNSPLGQLKGTANKVVIVTNTYTRNNPYIVESPGAGLKITAQNIRRDLLSMINERRLVN